MRKVDDRSEAQRKRIVGSSGSYTSSRARFGRRSSEEADDDSVPDWPSMRKCEHCKRECYVVESEDGSEVLLDPAPMDTELVTELYGEIRRVRSVSSYVHPSAYAVRGWRLLDPVRVRGAEGGWFWYASRIRLTPENDEVLYSEHVYVCKRVSPKVIEGLLSNVALPGAAVEDIYGSRAKRVAEKERLERWNELTREGYAVELPSEVGKGGLDSATQLPLFS